MLHCSFATLAAVVNKHGGYAGRFELCEHCADSSHLTVRVLIRDAVRERGEVVEDHNVCFVPISDPAEQGIVSLLIRYVDEVPLSILVVP